MKQCIRGIYILFVLMIPGISFSWNTGDAGVIDSINTRETVRKDIVPVPETVQKKERNAGSDN